MMICSYQAVHVAMTLDTAYIRGSMAAILSVLQHSSCPQNAVFHFVASATANASLLRDTISSSFPYLKFRIYPFDDSHVSRPHLHLHPLRPRLPPQLRPQLPRRPPSPLRTTRRLPRLRPHPSRRHCQARRHPPGPLLCPRRPRVLQRQLHYLFNPFLLVQPLPLPHLRRPQGLLLQHRRYGHRPRPLERRRLHHEDRGVDGAAEADENLRARLATAVSAGVRREHSAGEHRWNQHGLGGDNFRGLCRDLHPGSVSLLHWSGKGKPWARLEANRPCPLDALWAPYDLLETPFVLDS
ncbi:putative galacturonosyltransferase-like 1 [Prunus yedoensis var. nudiflora]|uniref:Putative galacturonosyltransferase-like 1 n=1 Tax=Prunus yedoensis var. nudiflora TaxID=2094558 RepID=A0A314Z4T6_PRUYE|nr:putative galacturonosyltransferase-like 1 [Prunus yedoensis var. nudiflora]